MSSFAPHYTSAGLDFDSERSKRLQGVDKRMVVAEKSVSSVLADDSDRISTRRTDGDLELRISPIQTVDPIGTDIE